MFKLVSNDLAYAAGFIEGDGCFHITKKGLPGLIVSQVDTGVLRFFYHKFKVGRVSSRLNRTSFGTQMYYSWRVHGGFLTDLIPCLIPYLLVKKDEARIVLAMAKSLRRNNKRRLLTRSERVKREGVMVKWTGIRARRRLMSPPLSPSMSLLAGLVESDGSISSNPNRNNTLRLTLSQKDPQILYYVREQSGLGSISKTHKTGIHRWTTSNQEFIYSLLPFLKFRAA